MKKVTRVLIVEDSMFFANVLKDKLSLDNALEILGIASNAYEARDKIIKYQPDVITLDVNMPKMNGIEFLKKLMPQHPLPVVMVSAVNDSVFDALDAGAVDFVHKPTEARSVESFIKELIVKIKIASTVNVSHHKMDRCQFNQLQKENEYNSRIKLIAIGASTGGTVALAEILKRLDKNVPGVVIVQHIPPVFSKMFAERMNLESNLIVKEAENGDIIRKGAAYIAPGNVHIRVIKRGSQLVIATEKGTEENKVNGHCPSVDVLFNSVSSAVGTDSIGVLLTGMGRDGADGLLQMREKGSFTIGQDEESSVVYGMPKAAMEVGAVMVQKPLGEITQSILDVLKEN